MMPKTLGPNRCNRGSILPLVAVSAPLLLGGAGFAVDVAGWYRGNQRLQMAADAAALESSRLLTNTSAKQSDFNAVATSAAQAVVSPSAGTLNPPSVTVAPDRTNVAVTLTSTAPRYFTRYFTSSAVTLSASATVGPAGSGGSTGGGTGGGNCVLALSNSAPQAIYAHDNGGITANDCGIFSNSSDKQSISVPHYNQSNGKPEINATGTGTVGAAGGVDYYPRTTAYISPMPSVNTSAAADPYANLTAPANGACLPVVDYSGWHSGPWQMQPGTYCQNLTFGNGTSVSFAPGLYNIINGSFTIGGGSQILDSPGASFYLGGSTPGTVQWNNGAYTTKTLSATTSGWMQGILIYRDRSAAPSGSHLQGGTTFSVSGVIYLPTDTLLVDNNAQLSYPSSGGLQVITQTINVGGSAQITAGGTLPSTGTARMALIQ